MDVRGLKVEMGNASIDSPKSISRTLGESSKPALGTRSSSAIDPAQSSLRNCGNCFDRNSNKFCTSNGILQELLPSVVSMQLKLGDIIFFAGYTPMGLYSVISGSVKLESCSEDGTCHTLGLYGRDSFFSYATLFSNESYDCSAICLTDVELCFFPKNELLDSLSRNPLATLNLLKMTSMELTRSEKKWVSQVNKSAQQRIAEAIIFLDQKFPEVKWTRREIAQWAGTTPETVIRTLASFEKQGMINQSRGRQIEIIRLDDLRNFT